VFDRLDVGVVLLRGNVDEFVLDHTAHKNSFIQLVMLLNFMIRILIRTVEE